MKITEILTEGGYASTLTQGTRVTPAIVQAAVEVFQKFVPVFNDFLKTKNLPPVKAGNPVGSTHYYKQDLRDNPDKTYGDIDIHLYIPRIPDTSDAANAALYTDAVKEFAAKSSNISTNSGKNVVFKIGSDYLQIDLVMVYYENREWLPALLPERGVKGVISSTVYSSLAELLNLSISVHGVQAKMRDGQPVSFRQSKNTQLNTVSKNPKTWALDILNFYYKLSGSQKPLQITDELKRHSGMNPENIKISDNVAAIKALASNLEQNGLLSTGALAHISDQSDFINQVRDIYSNKIVSAINSSKFDKGDPAQVAADREKLQKGLDMVLGMMV
jgi:hypothetical protein